MSPRKSSKIKTDGASEDFGSNPFASLDAGGLPEAAPKPTTIHKPKKKKALNKGRVEVRREKAGRGGKTVTTLKEFSSNIPLRELEALTFELKKTCACGGTLKGRSIELQGDVCDRVLERLQSHGFRPVRAGG
ncbi:MAG: translation initiation factor [Opitutaceae bacterium]